jgi:hypothetical protein
MDRINEFESTLDKLINEDFADLSYDDLAESLDFYAGMCRLKYSQDHL